MTDRTSPQVYQVFIKASPERVWQALTDPDVSERYFHGARITNTPETHTVVGTDGSDWGSGAVLEFDPPRRLVHEWSSRYDAELAKEPISRITWEIEDRGAGVCLLTATHDRLEGSPGTAQSVGGPGWSYVVSALKTLLETGEPLPRGL